MRDKFPGDLAVRYLTDVAEMLRNDASRDAGQRRMIGNSAAALHLAADMLTEIATGADARKLIDWRRKAMPMLRAVEAVHDAAHSGAQSWPEAIGVAAANLDADARTIERHFARWLRERGMTRADYLLF